MQLHSITVRLSIFRRLADLYDRLLQRLTLFAFYYVPVAAQYFLPRLRESDIREQHAGESKFDSGRYAIFVLWQPREIPWYVTNMLEALRRHEVNAIVVSNRPLTGDQLATLRPLCSEILVRGNKGFDFGAYKDAVLRLSESGASVSRLLMLNDSIYVFDRGLDDLLRDLLSQNAPMTAAYENWELHYHFQSFCLALSGDLLRDPKIQEFWREYRPISIRRWCIHQGEVKLSAAIRKAGTRLEIVYSLNRLLDTLTAQTNWETLLQYKEFIPKELRPDYPRDDVISTLGRSRGADRVILLRRLRERLSMLLMRRAQAHTGAFLFPKFLASPVLKRDIVYRELFTIYEVERMLRELGYTRELPSVMDDMRRRGTAGHFKGLARRRYRLGL